MLLDFLQTPRLYPRWVAMGGVETLRSYGVDVEGQAHTAAAWRRVRDALLARMPSSHLYLLQELESLLVLGRYAFVHAGVRPRRPLERQTERDLLWIRDDFVNYQGSLPKIIVHGHAWTSREPVLQPYRIGIDTGAYATGVLTAVRLNGAHVRVLQAQGGAPEPARLLA
jgi:serine/threonine protein phosphatase 1